MASHLEITADIRDPHTQIWLGELDAIVEVSASAGDWETGAVYVENVECDAAVSSTSVLPANYVEAPDWLARQIRKQVEAYRNAENQCPTLADAITEDRQPDFDAMREAREDA